MAAKKVSFRAKTDSKCPVCAEPHAKEELMSGGGRLIAGNLTPELRRLYEPSKKWGRIWPLAYQVQVCPKCLFAAYPKDFKKLTDEELPALRETSGHRQQLMNTLFGPINFKEDRSLVLGAASYVLAVDCYHLRTLELAPTPKKAVSAIRAAWLLDDLFGDANYRPYDKVRDFYYLEAQKNYSHALALMESNEEPIEAAAYILGPDTDQNWGFEGIIYLNAFLCHKYLDQLADGDKKQAEVLTLTKRYLSKLYGSGKSGKGKPSVIIDMAKELYDEMGELIEKLVPSKPAEEAAEEPQQAAS